MLVTKENIFLFITFQGTGNMQKKKSHAAYSKMFVNIFFKRVARVEAHSFPQALLSETFLHLGTDKVRNNNRMYFHAK